MPSDIGLVPPRQGGNLVELSVSELSRALKKTVEDAFGYVRVRGEISQPKRHTSGHIYLRLKDENAVIEAVCWKGTVARLSIRPEEGMEVVCTGRLTTYPGRSQYQLVIETMELAGEGALLKLLEERKRRLAAEGLFAPERKKRLPFLPGVIGVVTSPTGAVIRDILHRLNDRFPRHVLLWPVAVQGDGAAAQVAAAISGFNALPPGGPIPRPDLLIVARGGGSLEDLMAFNEELVVRAAAASRIPLISAVGHETDTTLIDHAADVRAPTPTAAAEMAVPVRAELLAVVSEGERRLMGAALRSIQERRVRVEGLGRGLGDPQRVLDHALQRLDDRAERLTRALPAQIERRRQQVQLLGGKLRHPREQLAEARNRLELWSHRLDAGVRQVVTRATERGARPRLDTTAIRRRIELGIRDLAEQDGRLARAFEHARTYRADRLEGLTLRLESVSYRNVLKRGYAVVHDESGHIVSAPDEARRHARLTVEFADGKVEVLAGAQPHGPAVPPAPAAKPEPPAKPKPKMPQGQGSLF